MHNEYIAEWILYIDGYICVDRICVEKRKWRKKKNMNTDSLFQKHNNMYAERTHLFYDMSLLPFCHLLFQSGGENLPIFNNQGKAIGDVCWCLV